MHSLRSRPMDDTTDQHALGLLRKASGISDLSRVTQFAGSRDLPSGQTREVRIEVWDRGPGSDARFHVEARDDDGRFATGNPSSDLSVAIATVHWFDLDSDPVEFP